MKYLKTPVEPENVSSCFHLYATQIDFSSLGKTRVQVMAELRERGIGTQVLYIPAHTMPYYQQFGWKSGDMPVAEDYYQHCLALPMYPTLTEEEQEWVIDKVKEFIAS